LSSDHRLLYHTRTALSPKGDGGVSTIAEFLASLGLSEYEQRFAKNDVEIDVLPELTDQDLEKLGVSLGHRRRMLRSIRELDHAAAAEPPPPSAPETIKPPAQDTAERRQLTVMFCDLVGSTALSTRLDPEDLRGVVNAYHRCCAELVERNGGFVAKYMGDGVLAYFGYPRASEYDAERAVQAGLALVEAVPKLATSAGRPLQVRIGIATGLVVVGDLIGTGAAQEQAVVGETPNLAARLQALAEPGAVLISASTRQLTGGLFEYRDLGAVVLKGFAEGTPALQVLGAGTAESRFEALRGTTTPLVGRHEEIDLLMRRWEQAKAGDGQVVLICGEPGIGKSRITQTIVERISGEPHTRLRYFCSPHHQDSALYPSIAQLERAAGFHREDTPEERLQKLEAVLAQGTNDLTEAVPLLADLLSVPTAGRYPALNLTPQKRRDKTLHAQLDQVEGLTERQPVLMMWEDIHWSDPTTRESLDLLVDRVAALRILVVLTFRPEFVPPWAGRPHVTMLTLSRLPPRQRAEMISNVTGGKALPKEIADQIIDRTDGVPLFVEELTKTVVESGMVAEEGDHYALKGPVAPLAIPTSLHASLLARLDRLAPTRELAQIGAALGRSFSYELISAVAPMPQQQIDDALDKLTNAELIFRRGTPPNAEYTFKHALVQEAAYSTLLRSQRQQVHARIVTATETQFPEFVTAQPALLAHHCGQAGLASKSIDYWLKAGRMAFSRCAMNEAVAQLRKGIEVLSSVSDEAARNERELELQISLGNALLATKGYAAPEPGDAFERARYLCAALGHGPQLRQVLHGAYVFRLIRGELTVAERYAEEIRQLTYSQDVGYQKYTGLSHCSIVYAWLGRFADAKARFDEALPLWNSEYRKFSSSPEDSYVASHIYFSRTLLCLGYVDQARLHRNEAVAEARRLSPYNLVYALRHAWYGDWAIRETPEAMLRVAEEMSTISMEHGFAMFLGVAKIMRGWCLCATKQSGEGLPLLTQGLDLYGATGAKLVVPFYLLILAKAYAVAGRPEEALNRLSAAIELIDATQERWIEAEILRLRGRLLQTLEDQAAAANSYRRALVVAREQGARFWELRAATSLARLWRDQGKRTEAHELLAPVYGWFTEGFDTPVLKEAKSLLDKLSGNLSETPVLSSVPLVPRPHRRGD
jgi:class 3 adenylate cyclase/predicted ATPase